MTSLQQAYSFWYRVEALHGSHVFCLSSHVIRNGDQKKTFKIVDTLLGRNKQTTLPKYDSPLTMASVMNIIFIDKIDNIWAEFPLL